jgi:hypothetical protein
MQQSITAIHSAARAIPQAMSDAKQHSPEWRYLLQQIRNVPQGNHAVSAHELARIYQAALPIFPDGKDDLCAPQKNALLHAIRAMASRQGFAAVAGNDELPAITGPNGEVLAEAE